MNIYDRIRELRIKNGLSQAELAKLVGYEGRSAISKVEKGDRDISQSMIVKYANALGVTPTYLLYGDDEGAKKTSPSDEIDEDEKLLISLFRCVPDDKKEMMIAMIRAALNTK